MSKTLRMLIWLAVALLGALALATIALHRGEQINAMWLVVAAACSYALGYRFYSKFIAAKLLTLDALRATPAERLDNGRDFVPTNKWVVFGHHFAAIAGPGPLVGPVLAAQFGYLPGTLWILAGAVFGGCVQDFVVLLFSVRRDGKSLTEMARDEIGRLGGLVAYVAVISIIVILLAVCALVVVNALKASPWGTFTIAMTIPIALLMGVYLRTLRPGKVLETSALGFVLVMLAIWGGQWVSQTESVAHWFTFSGPALAILIIIYGFAASALPVWLLLAPRDYLSTFVKLGTITMLALGIVALITIVLVWGIKESAEFNAVMVGIKIIVLLFFIGIAFYFVSPSQMEQNWHPFQPNGWSGTLAGAAVVFFAYIGFDAVSTVAEETKNPARDLPIGIIASLVICTIFYVVVAAVFTGLIPYQELMRRLSTEQAEPLTMALNHVAPNARWASAVVSFGSVVAHTAVLLVFQLGQPRIFFSMARDGLMPPVFAKVHPKFKTPHVTTILTGVVVGLFAAVMSIDEMVDLTNIGTLFAFVLVCVGIIILRYKDPARLRPFRVPFGPWLLPSLGAISCLFLMYYLPPTSWWRFVAWLMLGLSVYLSYGYARSGLGAKFGRARSTPGWLSLMALGSFLIAIGLLTIPHGSNFGELYEKMMSGMAEGKRTIISFTCIAAGLIAGIIGLIVGATRPEIATPQN